MIRLPPTAIGLGRRDIWELDNRRRKRKDTGVAECDRQLNNVAIGETDKPGFAEEALRRRESHLEQTLVTPFETGFDGSLRPININTTSPREPFIAGEHFNDEIYQEETTQDLSDDEDHGGVIEEVPGEYSEGSSTTPVGSPENGAQTTPRSYHPSKDEFHYRGIVEFVTQELGEGSSGLFSPLAPSDISTPQALPLHGAQRLRMKLPLPRSPLFISHNASSSPERPLTSSLTPHVDSRVASHKAPGIIFAEPARRPPRRSPRAFRHQTNSFSFDSSERASAAYEQERLVSASTIDNIHRPSDEASLHQELCGSSLQSAATSEVSTVLFLENTDEAESSLQIIDNESYVQAESNNSSPRMPPPFSAVPRKISNTVSLPFVEDHIPKYPPTSPIGPAWTPARMGHDGGSPSAESDRVSGKNAKKITAKSPSGSRISPKSLQRLFEACSQRLKSPLRHHGLANHDVSSQSPPRTPLDTRRYPVPDADNTRTSHSSFMVYDDELSPATQPQTPAELPEARHQSRYHPSFTAPVRRGPFRRGAINTNEVGMGSPRASRRTYTRATTRGSRSVSPSGMMQEGFRGLYGGRENGDEERDWVEGVRSNNAEARRWGVRDARNDDRNLRETPEPEDWRIGRRE